MKSEIETTNIYCRYYSTSSSNLNLCAKWLLEESCNNREWCIPRWIKWASNNNSNSNNNNSQIRCLESFLANILAFDVEYTKINKCYSWNIDIFYSKICKSISWGLFSERYQLCTSTSAFCITLQMFINTIWRLIFQYQWITKAWMNYLRLYVYMTNHILAA